MLIITQSLDDMTSDIAGTADDKDLHIEGNADDFKFFIIQKGLYDFQVKSCD